MKKLIDFFTNLIFGVSGGLTEKELSVARHHFSNLFPYIACNGHPDISASKAEHDKYSCGYLLKDNSIGYIFECSPMIFSGSSTFESLSTLLKLPLPPKTVVQTMLYADPYMEDILSGYKQLRLANPELNDIYKEQVEQLCTFYRSGADKGLWQLSGTPMRMFRLYISVKIPIKANIATNVDAYLDEADSYSDIIGSFKSTLEGCYLYPRLLHPTKLISLLHRVFNPGMTDDKEWNIDIPISKQIISAETDIERMPTAMRIGTMYAKCITPKTLPKEIDCTTMNNMIGYFGQAARSSDDDLNQIQCPFIISTCFIYENLRTYLEARASQVNIQQAAGTFAQGILLRKQEMFDMKMRLESGETYLRAIVQMWLFDRNEKSLSEKTNRVVSMWKNLNIEAQKERSFIMPKLLVSALPLGLYGKDYQDLQRDFILPATSAAYLMTVQAGYIGMGQPYMLFMDRRAQLTSLDILYTGANKNFLLTGGTGGGKSFFLNYLVNSYRSIGAKVRIIDIGESYKKLAQIFGGQFIKFSGSNIVINFFEGIGDIEDIESDKEKADDYAAKMAMLTGIIGTMALKSEQISSKHITLIETAIREIYKVKRSETTIDDIADWLAKIPTDDIRKEELAKEGYFLSLALQKYCSKGEYGRFFNGKTNISFNNPLAVVELDGVPEDLRKVVVLAFASMIEDEVYNGDRIRPTIVILDEAWQTLSENPAAAKFVEGLYRKIRKYNGSVGVATQSLSDTNPNTGKLKHVGNVLRMQSNIKFILPDEGLIQAKTDNLLNFSDFEWQYQIEKIPAKSLPKYSEIYVKSDLSGGIVRLTTDMFTYFICSSDATDNMFLTYWCNKIQAQSPDLTRPQAMRLAIFKAIEMCNSLGGLEPFKNYIGTNFRKEIADESRSIQ